MVWGVVFLCLVLIGLCDGLYRDDTLFFPHKYILVSTPFAEVKNVTTNSYCFALHLSDNSVIPHGPFGPGAPSVECGRVFNNYLEGLTRLENVKKIYSTRYAFAAHFENNELVVWGDKDKGGEFNFDSKFIKKRRLTNVNKVHSTHEAFIAQIFTTEDVFYGIYTWGNREHGPSDEVNKLDWVEHVHAGPRSFLVIFRVPGFDNTKVYGMTYGVTYDFRSILNIKSVHPAIHEFAVVDTNNTFISFGDDGVIIPDVASVHTWRGDHANSVFAVLLQNNTLMVVGKGASKYKVHGTDINTLHNVKKVFVNAYMIAAILHDNDKVVTIGSGSNTGRWKTVDSLEKVETIYSTREAFAAKLSNSSVYIWGWRHSFPISGTYHGVKEVYSSHYSFAAIFHDQTAKIFEDTITTQLPDGIRKMISSEYDYAVIIGGDKTRSPTQSPTRFKTIAPSLSPSKSTSPTASPSVGPTKTPTSTPNEVGEPTPSTSPTPKEPTGSEPTGSDPTTRPTVQPSIEAPTSGSGLSIGTIGGIAGGAAVLLIAGLFFCLMQRSSPADKDIERLINFQKQ